MRRNFFIIGLAGLAVLASATGCGDDGDPLVAVTGTITLDDQPLAWKSVRFFPEHGTPGQGAGASTDKDGAYTLLAVRPGATQDISGVPAGTYRVVVTEPLFPIDVPLPEEPADGTAAPAIAPSAPRTKRPSQPIPPLYQNPESTTLLIEVPAAGGVIDLKLLSKP